jgi:hypothetical protein
MHRNLAIFYKKIQQIVELIATKFSKSCAKVGANFQITKEGWLAPLPSFLLQNMWKTSYIGILQMVSYICNICLDIVLFKCATLFGTIVKRSMI